MPSGKYTVGHAGSRPFSPFVTMTTCPECQPGFATDMMRETHNCAESDLNDRIRSVRKARSRPPIDRRSGQRPDEAICAEELALRQSQEWLRQLTARLLHAQEEERRRVAREMHDDWTQRLANLGIEVARLERQIDAPAAGLPFLHSIQQQLLSLSEDVHALSRQLHPSILEDLGLVEALRSECVAFSRRGEIEVEYCPDESPATVPSVSCSSTPSLRNW